MKSVAIGLHLRAEDVEGIAEATAASGLIVSGLSLPDDQPLGDRDLLLRIADVRARLLERATFIAVRYGFTFRSAADAGAKIAANAQRWCKILEENRTRVELTLKVVADVGPALSRPGPAGEPALRRSGADYLRALYAAKNAASIDDRFRHAVEERLGRLCAAQRWITRDASSIEFAGLVERDRLDAVAQAGEALKRDHPGVPFLLSAPWPLEVFADVDRQ
ncbi:MAG TPA: GvpL/GvpF family gas vesicle protein [Thermoanaerobaculia bacterium]|nr:GvpL/GvpF family gas vesicle protein [Thermoanaerobaculia bacterium]